MVAPALADPLRAVCIADRALLAAGERAVVTAVTDAPSGADVQISWSADGGAVVLTGRPGGALWSPPAQSRGVFVIRAHIHVGAAETGETADCSARVAVIESPDRGGGEALISTRALVLPAAPTQALGERPLQLCPFRPPAHRPGNATLRRDPEGLSHPVAEPGDVGGRFPDQFPPARLNVTYVPIRRPPPDDFDQREPDDRIASIRNHYDYDRAFAFLIRLRGLPDADPSLRSGAAWIVSCQHPLGGKEDPRPGFRQNLSAVPPRSIRRG